MNSVRLKKSGQYILCLLAILVLGSTVATAARDYLPGEVLIKFKGNSAPSLIAATTPGRGIRTLAMKSVRASMMRRAPLLGMEQWKLPAGMTVPSAIKQLRSNPAVEYVEPNYRRYMRALPNDTSFVKQWGLQNTGQPVNDNGTVITGIPGADMGLVTAWATQTGSKNVVVVVLDDSIDINHPDLASNIWTNPGEVPGDGIDNDANGYVDDVHGWDFIANDNDPSADPGAGEGHGTAVAGAIGAVGNNAAGVAGVNWHVSIMPIKFGFDLATEIMGMDYAIANGAHILNASFGGPGAASVAETQAVQRLQNAGILLVAAAGNSDGNNDLIADFPSGISLPNVLSVAGSTPTDQIISWSHYGATSVDVAAPGIHIFTTQSANGQMGHSGIPGVLYDFIDGTSFSSPYVAGIAALVKAQYPTAGFQELKGRIMASVTQRSAMQGLVSSGGRADAVAALAVQVQPVLVIADVIWNDGLNGNGFMDPGETATLNIKLDNVWANASGVSATLTPLSGNLTVNSAAATYPDIASGVSQAASYNVTVSPATGYQVFKFKLDIAAAGGYAVTRYYQIGQGVLGSGVVYNGTLGTNNQDDYQFFAVDVPAGATMLTLNTTSNQDIDLMATDNAFPVFDFATYFNDPVPPGTRLASSPSGNETIAIQNPTAGTYVVTVLNYGGRKNIPFTVKAGITAPADIVAPVISLLGASAMTLTAGSVYVDPGATAVDNIDGDLTASITVVNTVNTAVPGVYSVTYNVSDSARNAALTVTRIVTVVAAGTTNGGAHVQLALSGGGTVDIVSSGQLLSGFATAALTGAAPAGVSFPFGQISYSTTVAPGASQTVTLTFSRALPTNTQLYKVNGSVYTLIAKGTGANQWSLTGAKTISLHLTDGGALDLDGAANGRIVDPVAVGSSAVVVTASSSGGTGGGCTIGQRAQFDPVFLCLFLISLLYPLRERQRRLGRQA